VLAHTEKAADPDDGTSGFAGFIEQELVDFAELFILLVVDVEADELGGAPLTCRFGGSGRRAPSGSDFDHHGVFVGIIFLSLADTLK
jgi:hypothetical protein